MTSDGWKDAYCDEEYYFACKKDAGALSTSRLASLFDRTKRAVKEFNRKTAPPVPLARPLAAAESIGKPRCRRDALPLPTCLQPRAAAAFAAYTV